MNKLVMIFAPVVTAGVFFAFSGSSLMESGLPDTFPEKAEYYTLSEKGDKLIRNEIVSPLQAQKRKSSIKAEMMSRCPNGVSYYLTADPTDKKPYFEGQVVDRVACHGETVCFFRIDKNEETLEAKSKEEQAYMPVDEWKKTMKGTVWSF